MNWRLLEEERLSKEKNGGNWKISVADLGNKISEKCNLQILVTLWLSIIFFHSFPFRQVIVIVSCCVLTTRIINKYLNSLPSICSANVCAFTKQLTKSILTIKKQDQQNPNAPIQTFAQQWAARSFWFVRLPQMNIYIGTVNMHPFRTYTHTHTYKERSPPTNPPACALDLCFHAISFLFSQKY